MITLCIIYKLTSMDFDIRKIKEKEKAIGIMCKSVDCYSFL